MKANKNGKFLESYLLSPPSPQELKAGYTDGTPSAVLLILLLLIGILSGLLK